MKRHVRIRIQRDFIADCGCRRILDRAIPLILGNLQKKVGAVLDRSIRQVGSSRQIGFEPILALTAGWSAFHKVFGGLELLQPRSLANTVPSSIGNVESRRSTAKTKLTYLRIDRISI